MDARERPIDQATLDNLWDFNDAELSERRFKDARESSTSPVQRAELATQQARALGIQGRFDEAAALLDSVDSPELIVEIRLLLERGRLHNSSARPVDALPLFQRAVELAMQAGSTFLAIDAMHMVAIADPISMPPVTTQALALAEESEDPRTRRWLVALHNNLGWAFHDDQRYDEAMAEFEAALEASENYGTPEQQFVARWAIARCLRSLGRIGDALAIQEQLHAEDRDDEYVVEELGLLRRALEGLRPGE